VRSDHPLGTLLFLVGPPGSGKSTLANAVETHVPSTTVLRAGECWRQIAASGNRFAASVSGAMQQQKEIPSRVFILAHKLFFRHQIGTQRIIVDGSPYSTAQVEQVLEAYRSQRGHAPRALAAILDTGDDECLRRMRARGRADDTETSIRQRLEVYNKQQRPIIEEAVRKGLVDRLIVLDAEPLEAIRKAI
jgi:adenylate kinase